MEIGHVILRHGGGGFSTFSGRTSFIPKGEVYQFLCHAALVFDRFFLQRGEHGTLHVDNNADNKASYPHTLHDQLINHERNCSFTGRTMR